MALPTNEVEKVEILPRYYIVYNIIEEETQGTHIKIRNSSHARIAWRVKTADENRIEVNPAAGVLEPKDNALIAVSVNFGCRQEDPNNDRITIEWTNTPDGAGHKFRREWFKASGMVRRKDLLLQFNH